MTVSLVTYDGERWVEACIRSVISQTYRPVELIVYDNASRDGTRAAVRRALGGRGDVLILESQRNVGYAAAHNAVIARAKGEFVCLLNQDAVLEAGFLEAATRAFRQAENIGAIQGLVLQLSPSMERTTRIDTTGLVMRRDRRILSRSQGLPIDDRPDCAGPVFGPDGPVPIYRATALENARVEAQVGRGEVLDESFFLYHEDTDLAWRLSRLGWKTWYEPDAIAWHARGLPGPQDTGCVGLARQAKVMPQAARGMAWRNQRLSVIKNDEPGRFLRDLAPIARRELGSAALMFGTDPRRLRWLLSWLRAVPTALRKRRVIRRAVASRRSETRDRHGTITRT